VKSNHALVDVGRDGDLSPEDGVLLGRCVIGKVERVGRWTSTFLLLTDSGYRGRAQLVHQADSGYVFGAKGILEGQGEPLCRLRGIASSDSVTVGDAVYAATREGLSSTPLYYGRVVEASLGPSDSEWKVLVEPVPVPSDLQSVQIMRTAVNNERLTAER
jgi:rod shape-determining protein MreC